MPSADPSKDRREVLRLRDELLSLLDVFFERAPLWRGTLYRMRRKCGKASCHCAQGEPHESLVLTDRTLGPQKTIVPLPIHEDRLRRMTLSYRRFRKARARLVKLTRSLLVAIDRLEDDGLKRGQQRLSRGELLRSRNRRS